ncbi:hypothetical protein AXF42_Ash012691 [Apostasia shenzhenica]|uniref:Late embryogenesis abundant protein LEA-2 subgroup domain-containing protein n=1 Tax=Apostasia shenzhenica TaxID=1088818 RepID=A0A2H9ZTE9_9ASPA|nr:hypothetical protein AXF42_Ash012691 [Apostasia shenzhenica]
MSIIYSTSPKHCADKEITLPLKKLNKKLLWLISTFLSSVFLLCLLIFLILRPSKPIFSLAATTVSDLTLSNSTIQATFVSHNPNTRVAVFYDNLRAYAIYRGQHITGDAELPPFYQGHGDTNLLSASLAVAAVPVTPSLGYEASRDRTTAGKLLLRLRLEGRLRWKVGNWVSGGYGLEVDCIAVVGYVAGDGAPAVHMASAEGTQCSTSV